MNKPDPLIKLRAQIDRADKRLLKILGDRFAVVDRIGEEKAKRGMPAYQKKRSREILDTLGQAGAEMGVSPKTIQEIYKLIFKEAIARQERIIKAAKKRNR